jgi:hypothetical protein
MSKPVRNIRLIGAISRSLNATSGTNGEIFFDSTQKTLRVYDGSTPGGTSLALADLGNTSVAQLRNKLVESKLSTVVYTVTVAGPQNPDTGNKYRFNGVYRPQPTWVVGYTYVFVQDDPTNEFFPNATGTTPNPHPLNFSADNLSGVVGGGTSYLTDVRYFLDNVEVTQAVYNSSRFNTATARQARITITNATPATLYYWCWNHLAMGNSATVADPGTGSGSGAGLAAVATSGSYDDLIDTPTLFSGSYDDLTNKPTSTQVQSDWNAVSGLGVILNKPTLFSGSYDDLSNKPTIFSGSYADLSGAPAAYALTSINAFSDVDTATTAPTTGQVLKWNGTNWVPGADATTGGAGTDADTLDGFDSAYYLNYSNLSSKPTLNGFALAGANTVAAGSGIAVSTNTVSRTVTVSNSGVTSVQAGTGISVSNTTGAVTVSNNYNYIWRVAGDDSTQRAINNGETVRFVGAGGVTTTTDAEGTVTITGSSANTFGTIAVAGQTSVAADSTTDTLTLVAGSNITITTNATTDTITIAGTGGGSASDSFATIAVAGQTSVVADSATDTLTLVAGSNITLTTDAGTDTITIASAGGSASNSFETIVVAGQSSVVADSATDSLTLAAGTGISIATNATTDTITITSTVAAGATAFTGLSDASTASMTVDQFYLPAITKLTVTANGTSAYRFDQYSTTDNPTIYAISGTTIAFDLTGSGTHPFLIRFSGANYNTGLVHVTTSGTVTTGTSAQGKTSGTLYWKIPAGISGSYGYLCASHGGMIGTITVKDISAI